MRTEHRDIDGRRIRFARHERPRSPQLVLTNALPQSILCWSSLWERLADRFDLLALDLPGFGLSEGSTELMRPSAQARFLARVLDEFEIDRTFVVGPDIGTPVALSLAAHAPDRLLGINVFDGPGTWPADMDRGLDLLIRSRLMRTVGARPPLRRALMKANYRTATRTGYHRHQPTDPVKAEYRRVCFDATQHAHALAFLGSYPEELPRLQEALPTIDTPTLITWGKHDQFVNPTNAHRLHELLPNSQLTIFDTAGHFSHEDADQEWLDTLSAFIEAHVDRSEDGATATPEAS